MLNAEREQMEEMQMLSPERLKEIRERLRFIGDQQEVNELFAELDQLREKLEVAEKALVHISDSESHCKFCRTKIYPKELTLPRHYEDISLEALSKIRGEKC